MEASALQGIDPRELLNVPANCGKEELKAAFKRLSKRIHPDKGGDEAIFQLVVSAFKALMKECEAREADRQHWQLKQAHDSVAGGMSGREGAPSPHLAGLRDGAFTRAFNEFFEKNRMENPADDGYGARMAASGPREELSVDRTYEGKYSAERFNRAFDEAAPAASARQVSSVFDLAPAMDDMRVTAVSIHEDRPADFGGSSGDLLFADYMSAHASSRLADPRDVGAAASRTFEQVKAEHGQAPRVTEDDERQYRDYVASQDRARDRADRLIRDRDAQLHAHNAHVNRLLLTQQQQQQRPQASPPLARR